MCKLLNKASPLILLLAAVASSSELSFAAKVNDGRNTDSLQMLLTLCAKETSQILPLNEAAAWGMLSIAVYEGSSKIPKYFVASADRDYSPHPKEIQNGQCDSMRLRVNRSFIWYERESRKPTLRPLSENSDSVYFVLKPKHDENYRYWTGELKSNTVSFHKKEQQGALARLWRFFFK